LIFIGGMIMILPERPPQANKYIQADKDFTVEYVDWREHMTEPVSQKRKCLSCYAFGVTYLIQAHYSIYGKKTAIFSEQQVIDCCKQGCDGCKGGYPDAVISYFAEAGLDTGDNYPYV
jgi:cathepsin L